MMHIHEDDLTSEGTRALLSLYLQGMGENSPLEAVFARMVDYQYSFALTS